LVLLPIEQSDFRLVLRYFTDAALDVMELEKLPGPWEEVGRLSSKDIYPQAKQLYLRHPDADGINFQSGTLDIFEIRAAGRRSRRAGDPLRRDPVLGNLEAAACASAAIRVWPVTGGAAVAPLFRVSGFEPAENEKKDIELAVLLIQPETASSQFPPLPN
jgi:hypothetical protein